MPPSRLLDLTRSLRRSGRVATGIDRVERAYLDQFISDVDVPVFGLMRTAFGYVLLDRAGMVAFRDALARGTGWGSPDILSRLPRGRSPDLERAEAFIRRAAVARCLPLQLQKMLRRHVPSDFAYYNTGHSNLTERVLRSVQYASGKIHVLIHDVIPLEYPQFQRPGTVAPFREKLKRTRRYANRIIYNSHDTRARTEAVMQEWGSLPEGIVAHLGTIKPSVTPDALPEKLRFQRPYFVTVSTIEPRKNHAFLLDLWDALGPDAPTLVICGARGWHNDAVFRRLDALPPESPVQEVADLSDGALAALVSNSAGFVFPSHAEGFGLPPIEARQLGTRVLCNDLDVLREILEDNATFYPVSNQQLWLKKIMDWEKSPPDADTKTFFVGPTWADHFKTVLRLR